MKQTVQHGLFADLGEKNAFSPAVLRLADAYDDVHFLKVVQELTDRLFRDADLGGQLAGARAPVQVDVRK